MVPSYTFWRSNLRVLFPRTRKQNARNVLHLWVGPVFPSRMDTSRSEGGRQSLGHWPDTWRKWRMHWRVGHAAGKEKINILTTFFFSFKEQLRWDVGHYYWRRETGYRTTVCRIALYFFNDSKELSVSLHTVTHFFATCLTLFTLRTYLCIRCLFIEALVT